MIKKLKTKKIEESGNKAEEKDDKKESEKVEDGKEKLSSSFDDNIYKIKKSFENCPDIIMRKVSIGQNKTGYFLYVAGMVDTDLVQRDFIAPVLNMGYEGLMKEESLENLPVTDISFPVDINTIIDDVLRGNTVFLGEGIDHAISCNLVLFAKRSIEEPIVEKNVKGSHEGFVESLLTNMSMLRRLVKNTSLKFKTFKLGATTNQTCAIAYIEGIASPELLSMLSEKIKNLNSDGFIGIGYIEQFITDHPNSPFPQYLSTERPDKTIAALLEGKFAIMLDGTPVMSIVPVNFFAFFKAPDDYTSNWMFGSFIGAIRVFAAIIAVFLPGLYISVLAFHYYTVPLNLLISLAESRSKVPFQPLMEALIMEITLELLRESTIRLPTYIGTAVGVVGGLIIGQSAVQAGLVSNLMIIVVAVTAIASFVIPSYDMGLAIRFIRFIVMLFSAVFGIIGITTTASLIIANLVILESLGQPYFQPWIPLKLKDLKDAVIRLPINLHRTRPDIAQPVDKIRGRNK